LAIPEAFILATATLAINKRNPFQGLFSYKWVVPLFVTVFCYAITLGQNECSSLYNVVHDIKITLNIQ
jgi:hypothetical protein